MARWLDGQRVGSGWMDDAWMDGQNSHRLAGMSSNLKQYSLTHSFFFPIPIHSIPRMTHKQEPKSNEKQEPKSNEKLRT